MHDDPDLRAQVNAMEIQENPLDDTVSRFPEDRRGAILGQITIVRLEDGGWGVSAERRAGLVTQDAARFDRWARERAYTFVSTEDPTIDAWNSLDDVLTEDPDVKGWYLICESIAMPDMSFLD
jgi:hypothetical protein